MSQSIKVSFVSPHFSPATIYGGPVVSSLNTLKELAVLGDHIKVSTTNVNRKERLKVNIEEWTELCENLLVRYYPETFTDRFSWPLFKNLKNDFQDRDVVWTHYIFSSTVPATLYFARKLGKPVLLSPRGSLAEWILKNGLGFKQQWLNLCIRPFSDTIWWHATSVQEEKEIKALFPNARVVIIPNGISLEDYQPKAVKDKSYFAKFADGTVPGKVIVSSGRLHKKKGFDILIQAFKNIEPGSRDLFLFIAGMDDGEGKNLQTLIDQLDLQKKVFLVGQLNKGDMREFLSNADIFALPSHNENFGNVYAEALASGLPILASRMTPWQDVEANNCGKWVENSVTETGRALTELLQSDLSAMGANASDYVKKFEWKNVALQFHVNFLKMSKI